MDLSNKPKAHKIKPEELQTVISDVHQALEANLGVLKEARAMQTLDDAVIEIEKALAALKSADEYLSATFPKAPTSQRQASSRIRAEILNAILDHNIEELLDNSNKPLGIPEVRYHLGILAGAGLVKKIDPRNYELVEAKTKALMSEGRIDSELIENRFRALFPRAPQIPRTTKDQQVRPSKVIVDLALAKDEVAKFIRESCHAKDLKRGVSLKDISEATGYSATQMKDLLESLESDGRTFKTRKSYLGILPSKSELKSAYPELGEKIDASICEAAYVPGLQTLRYIVDFYAASEENLFLSSIDISKANEYTRANAHILLSKAIENGYVIRCGEQYSGKLRYYPNQKLVDYLYPERNYKAEDWINRGEQSFVDPSAQSKELISRMLVELHLRNPEEGVKSWDIGKSSSENKFRITGVLNRLTAEGLAVYHHGKGYWPTLELFKKLGIEDQYKEFTIKSTPDKILDHVVKAYVANNFERGPSLIDIANILGIGAPSANNFLARLEFEGKVIRPGPLKQFGYIPTSEPLFERMPDLAPESISTEIRHSNGLNRQETRLVKALVENFLEHSDGMTNKMISSELRIPVTDIPKIMASARLAEFVVRPELGAVSGYLPSVKAVKEFAPGETD